MRSLINNLHAQSRGHNVINVQLDNARKHKRFSLQLCLSATIIFLFMVFAQPVQAKIELLEFSNDQMKDDYHSLMAELRCLVCQNQNLADSNAELAQDLRKQVYEMLDKGSSREDVVDFMVTRYGDFVMYRPPVKPITLLLWFGPALLFFIALAIVLVFYRKQRVKADVELSDRQKQRAHSLLDD